MLCTIQRLRAEVGENAIFDLSAVDIEGRCCSIYGPSGIGKSTFLKGLANGEPEHSLGSVNFKKRIGFNENINTIKYVPQHPPRFNFTVKTFLKRIHNATEECTGCDETLGKIVEEFGIKTILESNMQSISGGQLHRVHLASALSSSATLLLLDEPSAGLDKANKTILLRLLNDFVENNNGFVICCTHDPIFRWKSAIEKDWNSVGFPNFKKLEDTEHDKISAC